MARVGRGGCSESLRAAKQQYQAAQNAQRELTIAFDAIGMNFLHLDPVIHHALLKEAMAFGAEKAVENFVKLVDGIESYEGSTTEDNKANVLREIYRARAAKIDAASK
jgi:hypothetical protein